MMLSPAHSANWKKEHPNNQLDNGCCGDDIGIGDGVRAVVDNRRLASMRGADNDDDDDNDNDNDEVVIADDSSTSAAAGAGPSRLIRHAGRALIRGRFRRVWRPRYLELWDNGLVRYYELPASSSSTPPPTTTTTTTTTATFFNNPELHTEDSAVPETDNNNNNNTSTSSLKLPKATLRIFHARILDVTTFRDMQVGLPHGSYGFVFHGQREEQQDDAAAAAAPAVSGASALSPPQRRPNTCQQQQQQQQQQQLHLQHQRQQQHHHHSNHALSSCHPNELPIMMMSQQPRDYMCAVDTLEEAQSWVVALQWAALQESNYCAAATAAAAASSGTNTPSLERGWSFDSCDHAVTTTASSVVLESIVDNQNNNNNNQDSTAAATKTATSSVTPTVVETPSSSLDSTAAHHRLGKIVITKCRRYRWVRIGTGGEPPDDDIWDVAYEIDVLLLMKTRRNKQRRKKRTAPPLVTTTSINEDTTTTGRDTALTLTPTDDGDRGPKNAESSSSSSSSDMSGWTVQEWSLLRTAADVENLLDNLAVEVGLVVVNHSNANNDNTLHATTTSTTATTLDSLRRQVQALPYRRTQSQPQHARLSNKRKMVSHGCIQKSVHVMDQILRTLALEAAVVNSRAMKTFWGLLSVDNQPQLPPPPQQQQRTSLSSSGIGSGSHNVMTMNTTSCGGALVWDVHHPRSNNSIISKPTAGNIPTGYTMETLVKEWLQQQQDHQPHSLLRRRQPTWWNYQMAWLYVCILSNNYVLPCIVALISMAVLLPTWRSCQKYASMTMSIRLDVLLLSYIVAMQMGAWWMPRRSLLLLLFSQRQSRRRRRVESKRVTTSSSAVAATTTTTSTFQESEGGARTAVAPNNTGAAASSVIADADDTSEVLVDDASSTSIESLDLAVAAGLVDDKIVMQTQTSYPISYGESNSNSTGVGAGPPYHHHPHHHHHLAVVRRSSPLPKYDPSQPDLCTSCWSKPDDDIFRVRGETYLQDRIKIPSSQSAFVCRGVDVWITDNPERHIARHPSVLGGRLAEEDTFLVNFLLPFANFVAYFSVPPLSEFPNEKLAKVWSNFLQGDQQYRDARLKLLPVVVEGPWIVKAAVGPGTSPALLGKVIPLQYFFREPSNNNNGDGCRRGVYEVDVIITASTIAKGILSVVKGHTKSLTIAFAFIVEAAQQEELPETVLCAFQVHSLHLEDCPILPACNLDEMIDA